MRLSSIASPGFSLSLPHKIVLIALLLLARRTPLQAQTAAAAETPPPPAVVPSVVPSITPIAIVSLDSGIPGSAASVTGALQVAGGRAMIAANGTVVSGATTTDVALPHRGTLRVCASTAVKLAADSSVPSGDSPGLMMAIDHGAIETDFATGRNADILLTPDFRILIGGPGTTNLKVRLGQDGDTCVDNPGPNAPYVLVTSVFDGSLYRVQSGQRVMFQHGSLREVVDQEQESCGCPPAPAEMKGNDFPLAQSEGLAPMPAPMPASRPSAAASGSKPVPQTAPLVY
ncbi:MAG: hypothetical protein WBF42_13845, partial [Terracidiphilus sp.]